MNVLTPWGGAAAKRVKRSLRARGAKHIGLYSCGPFSIVVAMVRSETIIGRNQWQVSVSGDVRPTDEALEVIAREAVPDVKEWELVLADGVVHAWEVVRDVHLSPAKTTTVNLGLT